MNNTVITAALGIFLLICSVTDIKRREIKPAVLVFFALVSIVFYLCIRPVGIFEEMLGILTGLVFVALHFITDEKIGLGDGLLITVTGIFLGGRGNALLIMTAMILCALFSAGILVTKKGGKKTKIPFVPFVSVAYLMIMISGRLI